MDALQSLATDHRLIGRALDAFEGYVGCVETGLAVDHFDLQRFVAFFEDFADLYHHGKEEALVFPALVTAGLGWDDEPLRRVRRDHDQEHDLLRSLSYSGLQGEAWSEEFQGRFLSIAKEFIAFQRNHMRFENADVFPQVERLLSEQARLELTRETERYDAACRCKNGRVCELAEVLIQRYTPSDRALRGNDSSIHKVARGGRP